MTFEDLGQYFHDLPEKIADAVPDIVAETAVEYFKESFDKKSFDGNPWEPAKNPRTNGSLLVDSGALVNSIEPSLISREKVIISAGVKKAPYAKAHNEGFNGPVQVAPFTRVTKSRTVEVPQYSRNGKVIAAHDWTLPGGPQSVKGFTKQANVPQRQFMGPAKELAFRLYARIEDYLKSIL